MGKGLASSAEVTPDGRIVISIDLKKKLPDLPKDYANPVREFAIDKSDWSGAPPMSIVIMIVGSRGTWLIGSYNLYAFLPPAHR